MKAAWAYLALALVLCWPAWVTSGAMIGGGEQPDWTGTLWAWWWTGHALAEVTSPFAGTHNFFPVGQSPVAQYNLVDGLMATPLMAVLGAVGAFNAFCVVALVLNGLATRWLASEANIGPAGAWLAGAVVLSSPFVLFELSQGRPAQAWLVWLVLALGGLHRLLWGAASARWAAATGIFATLCALTYWFYGLFFVLAACALGLAALPSLIRQPRRLAWVGLAAALALMGVAPAVASLAATFTELPGVDRPLEPWMMSGRLARGEFGLAMAMRHGHWWGWPIWHVAADLYDKRLPLGLLGLAMAGLLAGRGRRLPWLAVAGLGYLLALGPYWKTAAGRSVEPALPYLWLYEHLPFFERLWWPDRFEVLVVIGLALLAGAGLSRIASRAPGPPWLPAAAGLALLLADERWRHSWAPVLSEPLRTVDTAFYDAIDGPVLTTPVFGPSESNRFALWAQIHHEQPVLAGLGDHLPAHRAPGIDAYVAANPLLAALARLSQGTLPETEVAPDAFQALVDDGFRWFVVDPLVYSPSFETAWSEAFTTVAEAAWGPADVSGDAARAWRLTVPTEPVTLPAVGAVEPRALR